MRGTLLRALVHVRRGVKGEPGASSESHPFDVESYVFIWSAHWLHVTVLPAAGNPSDLGTLGYLIVLFTFLPTCFISAAVSGFFFSVFTAVFLLEQEVLVSRGSLNWFLSVLHK